MVMDKPDWTRYSVEEFTHRMAIIVEQVGHAYTARGKVQDAHSLVGVSKSWAYALENVPTRRLAVSFQVAIQNYTGEYTIGAADVLRVWNELSSQPNTGEWDRYAHISPPLQLPEGDSGRHTYITIAEWKAKHGLPQDWQLGDPYSPGSDLLGSDVPEVERLYNCPRCLDAGWTRVPIDMRTLRSPQLVMCGCKAGRA